VENPDRPLADEVLGYIVGHPQAQGTVEGIAEWWLLKQTIRHAVCDVEAALGELVNSGLLIARQCSGGRTYYRLNRDKEEKIRRRLGRVETAQERKPDPAEPPS
jgi:hypothetical protein